MVLSLYLPQELLCLPIFPDELRQLHSELRKSRAAIPLPERQHDRQWSSTGSLPCSMCWYTVEQGHQCNEALALIARLPVPCVPKVRQVPRQCVCLTHWGYKLGLGPGLNAYHITFFPALSGRIILFFLIERILPVLMVFLLEGLQQASFMCTYSSLCVRPFFPQCTLSSTSLNLKTLHTNALISEAELLLWQTTRYLFSKQN